MKTKSTTTRHLQAAAAGFTLIEVMVVVVILAILASIVVPNIIDKPQQARIVKAKQDISAIGSALDMYKLDNFAYPTTDQGLQALVKKSTMSPVPKHWKEGGYLKRLPNDPWGNPYQYLQPGQHGAYDLYSMGPDQQPNTSDDISNWNLNGQDSNQ